MSTDTLAAPPTADVPGWGQNLASGAAGIALLHAHHARAGTGTWATAHRWATAMIQQPVTAHSDSIGLFQGAPAVAYALHTADQPAYQTALDRLDAHIAAATRERLARAHDRIDRGDLPRLREFDLIRGLTGLGTYLLHRHGHADLLREVLSYLVRLATPIHHDGALMAGWWTLNGPADEPSPVWAGGHANLGMAHGIAGPLALLSTAMRRGITVGGHADAIARICAAFDRHQCGTADRPWWPESISRPNWTTRAYSQRLPPRPSWCYGVPGQARAQHLAAIALADPIRQRDAEHALNACLHDPRQLRQLVDASVCHGWAGLVLTAWRAAADAQHIDIIDSLPPAIADFRDFLTGFRPPMSHGLLEGATGVRLTSLTVTAKEATFPAWDACLLITG